MRTQPPPTPADDIPCGPDAVACDTTLGVGIPDPCVNGWTVVAVTPCGPANPTVEEVCAVPEWRAQMDCSQHPLTTAPTWRLPETGPEHAVPIAGTGLFAVVAGLCLLRVGRRRATI